MDCVITAGGRPEPESKMYAYTNGKAKALADVAGRPMLERVVENIQGSSNIDRVIIVGLDEEECAGLTFARPVDFVPDQGGLVKNAIGGVEYVRDTRPGANEILLSSADIPLVTTEILDSFIDSCRPFDKSLYYNFVTKETMEARFPNSSRTFVKLKGVQVAGGDMVLVRANILDANMDFWETAAAGRKQAWKLARIIGFKALFKFLIRQLSIEEIVELCDELLGVPVRIMLSPHAEIAMDADKPDQIDLVSAELT